MKIQCLLVSAFVLMTFAVYAAPPLDRINSPLPEYGLVKGTDGYYFSQSSEAFGKPGKEKILRLGFEARFAVSPEWTDTDYSEGDPYFSDDGQRVCFVSDRPSPADPHAGDHDIWCASFDGQDWQPPTRMPEPINSPATEFSPVMTSDGSIYFASDRSGGFGQGDLYQASSSDGGGWTLENLGPNINSPTGEWNLDVSPDGKLLIFEASQRSSNLSIPGDLYLSERAGDAWSTAIPLSQLNTRGSELMPRFLSSSELTYASSHEGDADIKLAALNDFMPVPGLLAAMSRSAHEMVLLDPDKLTVRQRIPVGMGSHEIASSSDGRQALVVSLGVYPQPHDGPIEPKDMRWETSHSEGFMVIDLGNARTHDYQLPGCLRPHGVAVNAQANRGWITCEDLGEIREINLSDGELVTRTQMAKGVHKVMYLENSGVLVASNPDSGEVYLLDVKDGKSIVSIKSGKGAEALAASRDEQQIWVANGSEKTVCRINLLEKALQNCWPSGGQFPIALAVDEARQLLWVTRSASSDVVALSLETLSVVHEYALESTPLGMALDGSRGRLYLTLPRLNQVVMLDVKTGEVIARAEQIMEADDLDLIPAISFQQAPDT